MKHDGGLAKFVYQAAGKEMKHEIKTIRKKYGAIPFGACI